MRYEKNDGRYYNFIPIIISLRTYCLQDWGDLYLSTYIGRVVLWIDVLYFIRYIKRGKFQKKQMPFNITGTIDGIRRESALNLTRYLPAFNFNFTKLITFSF